MVSNAQLQQQMDENQRLLLQTIAEFKTSTESAQTEILEKFDGISTRLTNLEARVATAEAAHEELNTKCEQDKNSTDTEIQNLKDRISNLEAKLVLLDSLPDRVKKLTEVTEERTNRQLRETLVFHNVAELHDQESYAETKDLLAKLISDVCDISYEDAFNEIKRAHREANRRNGDDHFRKGKRNIFAAFHSWDLCQKIIETFKSKCIREPQRFVISVDQMYGPRTTSRRHMAMKLRKDLKASKAILGGYVDFPAKLMVYEGRLDNLGKKIYRMHTDFSKYELED